MTAQGRQIYKPRKETVEPTFGIIKQALGFHQFHLRGHPKVDLDKNWGQPILEVKPPYSRMLELEA